MSLSSTLKFLTIIIAISNSIKCQQQQQQQDNILFANLNILTKSNQSEFINLKNFTGVYISGSSYDNSFIKGQLVPIKQNGDIKCLNFSLDNAETKYIGLFKSNECPLDILIKFGAENKALALVIVTNLESLDMGAMKSKCMFSSYS